MNFNFKGIFNKRVKVLIITKCDSASQSKIALLSLSDNLLIIRKKLKREKIIDDTLSFTNRYPENNDESYNFSEISLEDEEDFRLGDIICESKENGNNYTLYLMKCSRISWKFLNNLHGLDRGCTMT